MSHTVVSGRLLASCSSFLFSFFFHTKQMAPEAELDKELQVSEKTSDKGEISDKRINGDSVCKRKE